MISSKNTYPIFFIPFKQEISSYSLPKNFTFPFYYEPHILSKIAALELQNYLETQTDWEHNFGLNPNQQGLVIGKMFGVLVVKTKNNKIGYLAAFSGKLAGTNNHEIFVPPVFDMLENDSFFLKEELVLNQINKEIDELENDKEFFKAKENLNDTTKNFDIEILNEKKRLKEAKSNRKLQRILAKEQLSIEEYKVFEDDLIKQSLRDKHEFNVFNNNFKSSLELLKNEVLLFEQKINNLKEARKTKSANLQSKLFKQYQFLNIKGELKNLQQIFNIDLNINPPAAAGECAAPKLLQYAFLNELTPICMAEFWWGQSPKSEIRQHKNFYPACSSKCEPILGHMLSGIDIDENPLLINPAANKDLEIVYEDEFLAAINKPAEFLSVPGINIQDSVLERVKLLFPNANGPLIVHRLDMSTSGILLIAKDKQTHKFLQSQFIKRTIKKRYVALLDGDITEKNGLIDLPLRVDLDDRPRQLVCYEYGKTAQTKWEIISHENGKTRVYFYPITGRTHQLRVHSAHHLGLNTPILGDDLYGKKANRLHLHAQCIEFTHPKTKEKITVTAEPDF